jgi:[lysine-biosynthesis-protein LysW]--L-2-aminoadipate ligase
VRAAVPDRPPAAASRATGSIAIVYDRLRTEEQLLFAAFEELGIPVNGIYAPHLSIDLDRLDRLGPYSVVIGRCLSQARGLALARVFEAAGSLVLNGSAVIETCGDKLATNAAFTAAGVPAPRTGVAFTADAVLELCRSFGYPVVMKPVTGSWGRMVTRLSDEDAVHAVIEHREVLGGPGHRIYYVQEYVEKGGRDIRAFVIGDEVICAIHRTSEHWITNTARGAAATNCPVTAELEQVVLAAARAVGGGMLAVDVIESARGLLVVEVNHTMEFRNSIPVTGVDIPGRIARHAAALAAETWNHQS